VKKLLKSPASWGVLAALGSASLLLGAFGFQYIGGLAPCTFCLWQRWPHALAVLVGLVSLKIQRTWLALLGAASALTSAGIGIFHTGVERKLWAGLQSCSSNLDVSNLSAEAALQAIMTSKVVKCDEVAWSLAGLSMASWNAIFSVGLALLWAKQFRRLRKPSQ
jgi:disulfide bond formation protein DsbB